MANVNGNRKNNSSVDNVLVVVDFQNGFIKGGSFGGHGNLKDLEFSIQQAKDIEKLIDANNTIVFTRDFHPINHLSIGIPGKVRTDYRTTWPSHCLNTKSICPRHENAFINKEVNNKENYGINNPGSLENRTFITIDQYFNKPEYKNKLNSISNFTKNKFGTYLEQPIIGTNISFLMYTTKYAPEILALTVANAPIGIPSETNKSGAPNFNLINLNIFTGQNKNNTKTFVQLTKGQLCRYESYSAFNYHWHIKLDRRLAEGKAAKEANNKNNGLATYKADYITKKYAGVGKLQQLSTGLFEYILKTSKKNINITVCGLVGEVCVINSVVEGLIMWRKFYQTLPEFENKKVVFNYSLCGTLFTGLGLMGFDSAFKKNNSNNLSLVPNSNKLEEFYKNMLSYLDNFVDPFFKDLIEFNILDQNGNFCQSIRYNDELFVNSAEQIKFN